MELVEVRETKNKGKGLYSLKNFKKGDKILFLDGEILEKKCNEKYEFGIGFKGGPIGRRENFIQYLSSETDWVNINHSCNSNCGLINDRQLIAIRNIKKGEEITQDYSTLDIEGIRGGKKELSMNCECGYFNCRKIITTFDLLDKKIQKKLRPYVNSAVVKLYNLES